jgi:hypothetical protein
LSFSYSATYFTSRGSCSAHWSIEAQNPDDSPVAIPFPAQLPLKLDENQVPSQLDERRCGRTGRCLRKEVMGV